MGIPFTLKERLMQSLYKNPHLNIAELVVATNRQRSHVRERLYTAKRQGFVKDRFIRKLAPWGGFALCHCWELTKDGKKWVEDQLIQSN